MALANASPEISAGHRQAPGKALIRPLMDASLLPYPWLAHAMLRIITQKSAVLSRRIGYGRKNSESQLNSSMILKGERLLKISKHANAFSYPSSSSVMAPFFTNGTCDPFHPISKPCQLGDFVRYAVNISKPEHISKALQFVKKHNIRLVIRNTGHEYEHLVSTWIIGCSN